MVSDLMIAKFVGKFYESLVTTLSDHALNFSDSDNFLESHPGWRLLTVLQSGTWRGDTVADYGTALLRWDRVVLDNQIAALRKIAEGWDLLAGGFGGSIARVIRDVAGRASMVADARERNHGIFAYPSVYIEKSIEELPFPPTLVIPSGEVALPVSVGYGEATAEDWANWMFLVNLVACVIHEAELSCPVKRRGMFCATANEVCDKLPTSMAREAGVGCAFYRFLIAIGVAREPRERQREPG
jgi:hypothetical protein